MAWMCMNVQRDLIGRREDAKILEVQRNSPGRVQVQSDLRQVGARSQELGIWIGAFDAGE